MATWNILCIDFSIIFLGVSLTLQAIIIRKLQKRINELELQSFVSSSTFMGYVNEKIKQIRAARGMDVSEQVDKVH